MRAKSQCFSCAFLYRKQVTDTDSLLPGIDSRHALRVHSVEVAGALVSALAFRNPGGFEFDTVVVSKADNLCM